MLMCCRTSRNSVGNKCRVLSSSRKYLTSIQFLQFFAKVEHLEEVFNPYERRVLKTVLLRFCAPENVTTIRDLQIEMVPFGLLFRVWSVIVGSLRTSGDRLQEFVRPKTISMLRAETLSILVFERTRDIRMSSNLNSTNVAKRLAAGICLIIYSSFVTKSLCCNMYSECRPFEWPCTAGQSHFQCPFNIAAGP